MTKVRDGTLTRTEQERDDAVKRLPCPVCGAGADQRCEDGLTTIGQRKVLPSSHMARYVAAVDAGLVAQIAGWPWTG